MEALSPQILREFGLNSIGIRREKAFFVCNTDKGVKMLQKSKCGAEKLAVIHYIKERLFSLGFENTDRFLTAPCGNPFAEYNGELYVAFDLEHAKEAHFDDHSQIKEILKTVAKMHALTSKAGFFEGTSAIMKNKNIDTGLFTTESGYKKQIKIMKGYKKMVLRQGRFSEFDILFLKYFGDYEKRLKYSMYISEDSGAEKFLKNKDYQGFSHNMIKEETVYFKDSKVYITDFSECSSDSFLYDLAQIIKRHLKTGGQCLPINEILETYDKINPISSSELKALHAILLIPDKFYKICVKYYSKKRTWTPASFNGVMEELKSGNEAYEKYINGFFEKL